MFAVTDGLPNFLCAHQSEQMTLLHFILDPTYILTAKAASVAVEFWVNAPEKLGERSLKKNMYIHKSILLIYINIYKHTACVKPFHLKLARP